MIILKYWKNILIVILLLVVAGSVKQCKNNQDDTEVLLNSKDSAYHVAQYYRRKNGEIVGQVKTQKITIDQLKEHGDKLGFDNKKLKDQVGNLKNLVAHWKGSASVRDTFKVTLKDTVIVSDTIKYHMKYFNWNNKYLTLDGDFAFDTTSNKFGPLTIRYNYDVNFELTAYYKKQSKFFVPKTWFKPKQLVTDIEFKDPNLRVNNFSGLVVTPPRQNFLNSKLGRFVEGAVIGIVAWEIIKK